jgi:hypothetical protein
LQSGYCRNCPVKVHAAPAVAIDKDATANAAVVALGGTTCIDTFHLKTAFFGKLASKGAKGDGIEDQMKRACCLVLRSREQDTQDALIDMFVLLVSAWQNRGKSKKLSQAKFEDVVTYIKMSLGYTGSQWEGSIGDLSALASGNN